MGSVRDFFVSEAAECLAAIERLLDEAEGPVDAGELLRHARTLRGSAQMAREDEVMTLARALEAIARAIRDGVVAWDPASAHGVRDTLDDLRALVDGSEPDDARAERIRRTLERWRRPGIQLPEPPAARTREADDPLSAFTQPDRTGGGATSGASGAAPESDAAAERSRIEFHAYVAGEISGILGTLENALPELARAPRGREPLKAILRRQRALLGSARLESLSDIAETLGSIDQVCRLIARQDVAVSGEWYEFFRAARDVLADAAARLMDGLPPAGTPSLQRLSELRDALLGRYDGEEEPRTPPPAAIGSAPSDVGDFFRSEARLLLQRVQRMAADLDAAPPDRHGVIRRELDATLSALRDTAGTFGYPQTASLAESARARTRRGTGADILALLPGLHNAIEATAGAAPGTRQPGAPRPDVAQPGAEQPGAPTPGAPARAATAGTETRDSGATSEAVVPVEELLYRGEAAIRRARELRPVLERAVAGDPAARDALDELYDLLNLIRS